MWLFSLRKLGSSSVLFLTLVQLAQATEILYEKLDTMNTSCIER